MGKRLAAGWKLNTDDVEAVKLWLKRQNFVPGPRRAGRL